MLNAECLLATQVGVGYLENNITVLNDALDLNLVNVDREQAAGSFSIDLVAA